MLKKLKFKFVIVIMTIVTILFGTVFGCVMYMTKKNIEKENLHMMSGMTFNPDEPRPDLPPENIRMTSFKVMIKDDKIINIFGTGYINSLDKDFLNELVDIVNSESEDMGIIQKYNLRYLKSFENGMQCIVFADMSGEKIMINSLIKNFIIIGFIGYTVFFIISILLAKWVTQPVEKAWNEQKQFIADASHELKTPLTVIMTNVEMLNDSNYTENDKKTFIKNILSMSKQMRGLIESLLELARMDNKTSSKEKQIFDYSKLVSDCILPFEPLFYEKNIELDVNIHDNINVYGDKAKLKQVIEILLDNALKYSDINYPVIIKLTQHGTYCILSVSGKGYPLSKSECKDIFKRFYRTDKARNDRNSYGLGLSIADSIIREHNGHIWAESSDGNNIFYITLSIK